MSDPSFEVDVTVLLERLAKATRGVQSVGKSLDNLEARAQTVSDTMGKASSSIVKMYQNIGKTLTETEKDNAALQNTLQGLEFTARMALDGIATSHQKAAIQAQHYADAQSVLNRLLRDTDSLNAYVQHQKNLNLAAEKQRYELTQLREAVSRLNSEESKAIGTLKTLKKSHESVRDSVAAQQGEILKLENQLERFNSAESKRIRQLEQEIKLMEQKASEDANQQKRLQAAKSELDRVNSAREKEIRSLNRQKEAALSYEKLLDKQQKQLEQLIFSRQQEGSTISLQIKQLQSEAAIRSEVERHQERQAAKYRELKREVSEFNSALSQEIRALARKKSAMQEAEVAETSMQAAIAKTSAEIRTIGTVEDKLLRQLKLDKQLKEEAANATAKWALEEAKLARELEHVQSAQGKRMVQMQQQIREETRAIQNSTEATQKKQQQMRLGAQATAALRAGLNGLKTSIGMYTSATIVAATTVYAFTRALRATVEVGADFTTTMARTQAIMSSSAGASKSIFDALEARVRTLGQTTQFTASQVAEAVTELGQAGLSAGQAMVALQPTLDLAIIGNLSMASSADHATNIMMIFGKQVGDLTDIVDVMAMAVTNSNTNIDQLANALTYAGPAAHTAGISMRDTVAAVEALANSGFKASRAGTALRRFFVSILNPTKKGQAMLDKYNISVLDLEGNTRNLTDIIGQLSKALEGVSGAEKLSAIQDLVGVYATSPIAALVDQAKNFEALRVQLDLTASAADRMRKKIEDSLTFDFKEAKSAFQELQLQVFKDNEYQLRVWVQELTGFLNYLGETVDGGVTRLEQYAKRIKVVGVTIAGFIAISKLNSLSKTLLAEAKAQQMSTVALQKKHAAMVRNGTQSNILRGLTLKNIVELNKETAAINSQSLAWSKLEVARSRAVGLLTKGMSVVSKLSGWGLAAWGVYEVLTSIFGSSSEIPKGMVEHEGKIVSIKEKYDALKQSAAEAQNELAKKAVAEQIEQFTQALQEASREAGMFLAQQKLFEDAGMPNKYLESRATLSQKAQKDALATLEQLIATQKKLTSSKEEQLALDERITKHSEAIARQERIIESASGLQAMWIIANAQKVIRKEMEAINKLTESRIKQESDLARILQNSSERVSQPLAAAKLKALDEEQSKSEKLAEAQFQLIKAEQEYASIMELSQLAVEGNVTNHNDLIDKLTAAENKLANAQVAVFNYGREMKDVRKDIEDVEFQLTLMGKTEAEKLELVKKELKEIVQLRAAEKALIFAGIGDEETYLKHTKHVLDLMKQIESIGRKGGGKGNKEPRKTDAQRKTEQELKDAEAAFKNLQKSFDASAQAKADMEKGLKQMKLLLDTAKISTEQYTGAVSELRKAYYDAQLEADKNVQAAKSIREAYLHNATGKYADDVWKLERSLEAGTLSMQGYGAASRKMSKDLSDSFDGLPKADFQLTNNSGPFQDHLRLMIDQAEAYKQYDKALKSVDDDSQRQILALAEERMRNLEHLETIYQDEVLYKQKKEELDREYSTKVRAIAEHKNASLEEIETRRLKFEQQSRMLAFASLAGSLADTLGLIADASENATSIQKVAFAAQKALAVAQIIVQTHVAAANASAIGDPVTGRTLYQWIMAQGYASAGLVAGLAIGELSGGSKGFAGMYDKGGYIPDGQYGIVGEYGPEIVNGPAHVTGREDTARKLGKGGDTITIAPEINIEYTSEGSGEDDRANATMMANTVKAIVVDVIKDQLRPNGMLARR